LPGKTGQVEIVNGETLRRKIFFPEKFMVKPVKYLIIIFYLILAISTGDLFIKNLEGKTDLYALFFQVSILAVCVVGLYGIFRNAGFSTKYNRRVIFIFSVLYGLALLNAIFFKELHLMGIREAVMYTLLAIVDYFMVKEILHEIKSKH